MKNANQLCENLKKLKDKRKNYEINEITYYKELLNLLRELIDTLKEENISDSNIKKQIPLIVLFISEQVDKLSKREK